MSAPIERPDFDQGFIEHSVQVYFPDSDHYLTLPGVIIGGLALELAEMLRPALPGTKVGITRIARGSEDHAKAEDVTHRVKRRVIAAREETEPGRAFLRDLGYWGDPKTEQHQADQEA